MAEYAAFISYRHVAPDDVWAERVLHDLETFVVPQELRGRNGYGRTIGRVFRDREELPAAGQLSPRLRQALEESENLIVVCSPETPHSPWVNEEVAHFIALGRRSRIFPLLIDGTPETSFPAALLGETVDGLPSIDGQVPLAADVRPDGALSQARLRRRAVTMLAAAILDVGFDELVRRHDARRRRQRGWAGFGAATAAAAIAVTANVVVQLERQTEAQAASEIER
ncbi:MAG: toll/interleukin-1 receptor domain-containing protein, partial [Pseudomonadota bacterium]